MGLSGQRAASNPSAMLAALVSKRDKLQDELRVIERQVGPRSWLLFFSLPRISFRLPTYDLNKNKRRIFVGFLAKKL